MNPVGIQGNQVTLRQRIENSPRVQKELAGIDPLGHKIRDTLHLPNDPKKDRVAGILGAIPLIAIGIASYLYMHSSK